MIILAYVRIEVDKAEIHNAIGKFNTLVYGSDLGVRTVRYNTKMRCRETTITTTTKEQEHGKEGERETASEGEGEIQGEDYDSADRDSSATRTNGVAGERDAVGGVLHRTEGWTSRRDC